MKSVQARLAKIEQQIKSNSVEMLTVYYKDGSVKKIHPMDAIQLALFEADKISCFEEESGCKNCGVIEGLVNALLIVDEEEGET